MCRQLSKPQVLKIGYATILVVSIGYIIACWAVAAEFKSGNAEEDSRFQFMTVWSSIMVLISSLFMLYTICFQAGNMNSPIAAAYVGAALAMLFMMCNSSIITMVQFGAPPDDANATSAEKALAAFAGIYGFLSLLQLTLLFLWFGPCSNSSPEPLSVGSA